MKYKAQFKLQNKPKYWGSSNQRCSICTQIFDWEIVNFSPKVKLELINEKFLQNSYCMHEKSKAEY